MPKLVLFSNFTIPSVCLCSLWHFPFSLSKRFFSFPISVLLFPAEEIVYISQCSPPFLLRLYPLLYIKYFLLQTLSSFNSSVFLPFSKKSKDKAEFEKFTFCCYTCLSLNLKDVSEKLITHGFLHPFLLTPLWGPVQLLTPWVGGVRVERLLLFVLADRHQPASHQVAPPGVHLEQAVKKDRAGLNRVKKSNLFSSWLYLEHNGLFILQEGNGARGAVAQLFLKTLPWRDCGWGVAGEGRGGEGSLHWCACILGCCQPQSRHLRRRDTENVEK